jgi:hypothetical protein
MEIKFLSDKSYNTGYTYLFGHHYPFDTYKAERVMRFFYPEILRKSKIMLTSLGLTEEEDYTITL